MDTGSKYSLKNMEIFYPKLTAKMEDIQYNYSSLISEYLCFILENIKIKNDGFLRFIIQRGIFTITNVFNMILFYSKNLDVAYYHSQKAFYFYVEFIGQISEDQNTFLQLSSRDATMFVYKKTIFEINSEFKQKEYENNKQENDKLLYLEKLQCIYKNLIDIVLEKSNLKLAGRQIQIKEHLNKVKEHFKKMIQYNLSQLNCISSFIEKIKLAQNDTLSDKDGDKDKWYKVIDIFLKKISLSVASASFEKSVKNKILHWNPDDDGFCEEDVDNLF